MAEDEEIRWLAYFWLGAERVRRFAVALSRGLQRAGIRLIILGFGDSSEAQLADDVDVLWHRTLTPDGTFSDTLLHGPPVNDLHAELIEQLAAEHAQEAMRSSLLRVTGVNVPREPDQLAKAYIARLAVAEYLIGIVRPRLVLVWNGHIDLASQLAQRSEAHGIPVLYGELGSFADTVQVDPEGVNGRSSISGRSASECSSPLGPAEEAELDGFLATLREAGRSGWEQPDKSEAADVRAELGVPPGAKVLFYPGQVDGDSNITLNSPHFTGNSDVLQWLCGKLRDQRAWHIVAKEHPKAEIPLEAATDLDGHLHTARDVNIHSLIDLADAVVSINSAVIFEAVAAGKPVLALGNGLFSNKGIVLEAESRDDATSKLRKLLDDPNVPGSRQRLRRQVLHGLIFEFLFRYQGDDAEREMDRLVARFAPMALRNAPSVSCEGAFEALQVLTKASRYESVASECRRGFAERDQAREELQRAKENLALATAEWRRYEKAYGLLLNRLPVRAYRAVKRGLRALLGRGATEDDSGERCDDP
ncbi:MAG: capsular polysaccharide export protein, LipB/KpsS family [Planctomycetota bacterium]|jgi:capsular polysaccharide export protein